MASLFPFCSWPKMRTFNKNYFPTERLGNQQYKFIPPVGHQNYTYNPATLYLVKYAEMTPNRPMFLSKQRRRIVRTKKV